MKINLPPISTKRWTGIYLGSYVGLLWKTFNVNLNNVLGKINLSRLTNKIVSHGTLTNLGVVTTFLRTNADATDRNWGLCQSGRLFNTSGTVIVTGWAEAAATGATSPPTDSMDMAIHELVNGEERLLVTRATNIDILNRAGVANAWTNDWWTGTLLGTTALTTGIPHPIDVFERKAIIGDDNFVHVIDKNDIVSYKRLILRDVYQVEHIFHTPQRIWILCSHKRGGMGAVYEWDGYSISPNAEHSIFESNAMSGIDFEGLPIVLNNKGIFLEFNGRSFTPMIRNGNIMAFPIAEEEGNIFKSGIGSSPSIAARGMTTTGGLIYLNMGIATIASPRYSAGIWCLDPKRGVLYNNYSIGQTGATVDYGQQDINLPGAILAVPGATTKFLIGGSVHDVYAGAVILGIWNLDAATGSTLTGWGYFITNMIPIDEIEDMWTTLWIKHKRFTTSSAKIIVKAKGVNSLQDASGFTLQKSITWASTTTFTVTLAAGDNALAVGDEVEILGGDNAGICAHITIITGAHGAAQTITIDETVTASTSAALARFDRWKKLGSKTDLTSYVDTLNIGIRAPSIQFKVVLKGIWSELEIDELIINTTTQVKSKR